MQIRSSNLKELYTKIKEMKLIQYSSCRTDFSNPNFKNSLIRYPAKLLHFRNWEDFGQQQRKSILFETLKDKVECIKNEVNEKYNLTLCVCENNEANFNYYPSKSFIPPHVDRHPYTILTLLDTDYPTREENSLYYLNSTVENDIHHLAKLYYDFNNQADKTEYDYIQFRTMIKQQTNVCEIKLKKGESILFHGGKFFHFTIPKFSGYREIATLNFYEQV